MTRSLRTFIFLLCSTIALGLFSAGCATELEQTDLDPYPAAISAPAPAPAPQQSPAELQQLVAPIALYPDELVAQILAGATYPSQVVEADRWLQQHQDLKGDARARAVDSQSWDPSVKALTQFPGLLGMLDTNLSWTSALGEAYLDAQQPVLDAIQVMRQRAQQAGNLKTTPQESVTTQGDSISIEPANPDVVYIPEYDPWFVYGDPLDPYDDWAWYPGFYFDGPGIGWGLGIGIGLYGGFGWGWHQWRPDWHGHNVWHGDHQYVSHTRDFNHGNGFAGERGDFNRSSGMHTGAFSGFNHGGYTGAFSVRGRSSFGLGAHGAGGFHGGGGFGGGGGFHGGGGGGHR
jgi:uncharacterized membrane protein YgcG